MPTPIETTAAHKATAEELAAMLRKYNDDEGYEYDSIVPSSPLLVAYGSGGNYTGNYNQYTWYQLTCITGGYTETGWIAQHPRLGFIWAENLDGEED